MKYKIYTIEGKEFNAVALGKELGVSQQTARNRLNSVNTIKDLYRPLRTWRNKIHIIDGEEFTAPNVAKILNCSNSVARARLIKCKLQGELFAPLQSRKGKPKDGKILTLFDDTDESRMRTLAMRAW